MPIPQNKLELIKAIQTTYSKLKLDLESIPSERTIAKELSGHAKNTTMSVCNLVAYLIGWGELVLKWNDKHQKGEEVIFPEEGFKWNQLGDLAQKFYQDYEKEDFEFLLKKLDQTVQKIIALIESVDNHQLYKIPWYERYTMGRMIQLNTSSPYKNARTRLRKWKREHSI